MSVLNLKHLLIKKFSAPFKKANSNIDSKQKKNHLNITPYIYALFQTVMLSFLTLKELRIPLISYLSEPKVFFYFQILIQIKKEKRIL